VDVNNLRVGDKTAYNVENGQPPTTSAMLCYVMLFSLTPDKCFRRVGLHRYLLVTYLLLVDDGLEKQSFIGVHF